MPEEPTSYLGFYRQGLTSAAHRRHISVGRTAMLQDTMDTLRANAARATKHHLLFIGLRGMGKTHFLSLIEDEIAADPALAAKYLVARFPEESNRTLSFADFLLGLCEILAAAVSGEPLWAQLHAKLLTEEDDLAIVDTLVPALRKENQTRRRTLVIMLENLGEIFSRQMKDRREVAALRKFLMDSKNGCLLIATAAMQFSGITSVDEPFYDFFDVQHLDHLSEDESIDLIRKNLEWEKREDLLADFAGMRPRLLALYRMTGGNPRLTVMLSELISRDSVTRVRDQFRILLDRITPFYQDRLGSLPPQERALLETMAMMRDQEKTPASIGARMRMKTTHVSSLLKRLSVARLLRSSPHPNDKRTSRYTISEGFFDIWLAMNLSRGARERLPFLLDFFATFYPTILDRDKKRRELLAQIAATKKQPDALAALDTFSEAGTPEEKARAKLQLASVHRSMSHEKETGLLLQEAAALPLDRVGTWIVRRAQTEPATDYLTEIQDLITAWDEHRDGSLEGFIRRLKEWGEGLNFRSYSRCKLAFLEDNLSEVPAGPERILLRLKIGNVHRELAHWKEAENQLRTALAEAEQLANDAILSATLNNFAHVLYATNRLAEAEPLLRRALSVDESSCGSNHQDVVTALNNLALLLQGTNRLAEAEPLLCRALAITEAGFGLERPEVATVISNLAQFLQATNRFAEAEPLMRRALAIDETSFGPEHPTVAIRLNNLAALLQDTKRLAEAEPLIRRALAVYEASLGSDHPDVATALNNLAQLLKKTNRLAEAEPLIRRALAIDEASFGPDHPDVGVRLNNLAQLLEATNRLAEAEPLMRQSVVIFLKFTHATAHPHPHLEIALKNCRGLWREMGVTPGEIRIRLSAMLAEAGITPEQASATLGPLIESS
jgi:tetratricopeptide (TPR) repeat protein